MIDAIFKKALKIVTDPVTEDVQHARLRACMNCERLTKVNPYPGANMPGCAMCGCPIDTLTASRKHPELLEGKLSTKMVDTVCKHPTGSKWVSIVLFLLISNICVAQLDTSYSERVDNIENIDFVFYSIGVDTFNSEPYVIERRASKDVVRQYMEVDLRLEMIDSLESNSLQDQAYTNNALASSTETILVTGSTFNLTIPLRNSIRIERDGQAIYELVDYTLSGSTVNLILPVLESKFVITTRN